MKSTPSHPCPTTISSKRTKNLRSQLYVPLERNPDANNPNGVPDEFVLVRHAKPLKTLPSHWSDNGEVRCKSANRSPEKKAAKGNNPKSQCPETMSHAPKCVFQIAKGCTECMEDSPSDHVES